MGTLSFLILFPLIVAGVLLVVRNDRARGVIVTVSAVAIAAGSIALAVQYLTGSAVHFEFESEAVSLAALGIDLLISLFIIFVGLKHKQYLAVALAAIQAAIVVWFDLGPAHAIVVENNLYVDTLSVIMALIIGIIGSGICVYAIGYMRDFAQHHADVPDRRPMFFAVMFLFLSAMFGVVFSNNLSWLFTAWEVTTVCSFLLIGYTRTPEATNNAFLQIVMNLAGGLGFAIAIAWIGTQFGTLELSGLISLGLSGAATVVPVLLLAFAAMTKAAQMPFHTWLLGAMVAPTPTSALLHSSTMVKAGVFLLLKLSPVLGLSLAGHWNVAGITVQLVGGVTFLMCSLAAITQSNAKRVLAYSTIANLGLITACAGIGTSEAVWAAIFLIIFHAAAKSLLFLCVGTAEHHIGSRDIEDMDGLFTSMPSLARFMVIGIAGMFIAPFGMLVSKWAALGAFVDSGNIILVFLLVFGSAATFFFWAKWLAKVTAIAGPASDLEASIRTEEWASIALMALLTVLAAVAFPLISSAVVVPYLGEIFPAVSLAISQGNLMIMAAMAALLAIILGSTLGRARASKRDLPVYMGGVGISEGVTAFSGSLGDATPASTRNWYLESYLGEGRLSRIGTVVSVVLLICGLAAALIFGSVM
ncbi:MAG: NADH-quinone oxidoreductase subunit L [Coriobacteriia bacterium]|nr:NADH-quinone oxidoreductase subunit L [Coriobacteriia bacterium]